MKIRTRLLLSILPPIIALVLIVSYLSYITWHKEILKTFRSTLQGIAVSSAQMINSEDHEWLAEHADDPEIAQSAVYQKYSQAMKNICKLLPISSMYTIKIQPVAPGEVPLLNEPESEKNRPYDGHDPQLAYRQIYILDADTRRDEPWHKPGSYGFSDAGEFRVYLTKKPYVSSIYQAQENGIRYMTGYAPIMNEKGDVIALVGADLRLELLDQKAKTMQGIIALVAIITIACTTLGIAFIANKISQPVEELKNAALVVAGGNLGQTIQVDGPQEIKELANALNTLSECMRENLTRLEETSVMREKLLGKKECFRILQNTLIEEALQHFKHPHIKIQAIDMPGKEEDKPIVIEFPDSGQTHLVVTFKEALKKGLDGVIDLFRSDLTPRLMLTLNKEVASWRLSYTTNNMPKPLIWSAHKQALSIAKEEEELHAGDFIILVNNSLATVMSREDVVHNWFARAFHHFANVGIEACMASLKNEFLFLAKKQRFTSSLQLI